MTPAIGDSQNWDTNDHSNQTFLSTLSLKLHWEVSEIPQDFNQSPIALKA